MRVISKSKSGIDVNGALEHVLRDMNDELKTVDGVITKSDIDISAGPSGACVTITVAVNGSEPRRKEVIGVNRKGVSREHSMRKAAEQLNKILEGKSGEISDIYTKTVVSPVPGRVYTTIIAAINEDFLEVAQDANIRRQRIKKTLELLNNDPSAINVARVAEVFGVSRTMIYRDLEVLGFKRAVFKEEGGAT